MDMDKRRHDTRVALRKALHIHGPEAAETRHAAIEFCYARNINPHFRYAIWPEISPPSTWDFSKPLDLEVYSETEWQRVVKHFKKEDA